MGIMVGGTTLKFNKILYSNEILKPSLNTVFMIIYHTRKKKGRIYNKNAFQNIFAYYVNIRHYFAFLLSQSCQGRLHSVLNLRPLTKY